MDPDFITQAAFQYLENGEDLPPEASKNPASRFAFQMAILKQTYHKSGVAGKTADSAHLLATTNRISLAGVIDKVNIRLGIMGGITILANAVMSLVYWLSRA